MQLVLSAVESSFHAWLIGRRLVSAQTANDYLRHLRRLYRHAGVPSEDLRSCHLEAFLADPLWGWSAKNLTLIVGRMYHRWGADRGKWPHDPDLLDMRLPRRRPPAKLGLSPKQARDLIAVTHSDLECRVIYLGLFAGLRLSEILALSAPDWQDGVLRIVESKGGKSREVPVHMALAPLRSRILGTPCQRKWLQKAVHQFRETIERPDLTVRLLRTTFGQQMSRCGNDRAVIGHILGHQPMGVTETNYVPVCSDEDEAAMRRLSYGQMTLF